MSLRFYFGPSGSGKSRILYEEIIRESRKAPRKNFLIIVPDQFTMQTQKDLVMLHDRGGIMNIDVLSFGRVGYRILEEVGKEEVPVLDDTGKSLVLQKVAAGLKEELPTLGGLLARQGYIHEIKSAISEFKQYGVRVEDMDKLIDFSEKRGALIHKLKDLKVLYKAFQDYISGKYITTEETLDVLRESLKKSRLVKESVVIFDGFTGFTPIQNRVIQELMTLCSEVIVTVTMGAGEYPYVPDGEQKLFYLGKKTVHDLERLAKNASAERGKDKFIIEQKKPGEREWRFENREWEREFWQKCELIHNDKHRFMNAPALHALEKGLFQYKNKPFEKEQDEIVIFETSSPSDEVHQTGLYIKELVQKGGYAYRDIAVITGELSGYAPFVESEFGQMEIPCYVDRTRGILLNPMIEFIKSGLELFIKDFSYEAVFHYLRSGMSDIPADDVDQLENYVRNTGIRGRNRWEKLFTRKTASMGEEEEKLKAINQTREKLMKQTAMLHQKDGLLAKEYVDGLYDFLVENEVQKKLAEFERKFHEEGDLTREREYAQIYRLVMELLDQIYGLLGDESISLREFADILDAGFNEIEVGTIPQNVDRVLVGDMERTRLKQVKVLFFMGINDGNIPKHAQKGGLISDTDREFLSESEIELAPTPRQQMFIQRLYLYLNMTKPSERLFLSYSKMGNDGKSKRPSYLVDVVRKMFPSIRVEYPQNRTRMEQIVTKKEGVRYLAEGLREYNIGTADAKQEREILTIYAAYGQNGDERYMDLRRKLTDAAFRRYQDTGLSGKVARALYGIRLENSVSRLETYSECAYRHFLQYGLSLKEREEFGFEAVDMGNVYHGVLEIFSDKLSHSGYTWLDFTKEFAEQTIREAMEQYAAEYGSSVLYSNSRNEYAITRMSRILVRTVLTIQNQLGRGVFLPDKYEMSFSFTSELESVNVALSKDEKMRLKGRIDRVDTAEDAENVYIKVVDYKSGKRQFDIAALYYGLQLQLVVYMNAAVEMMQKKYPGKKAVPAAMLYYHIDDPAVETAAELSEEEINRQIIAKLKMNGVVNSRPEIIEMLDGTIQDKSDVIPVEKKKDGSFSARSGIMSSEEMQIVSEYVNRKMKKIGREMLDGKISVNPYEMGKENACTYCAYKKACGFDPAVSGYEMRKLEELDKEQVMEGIRAELEKEEQM